MAVFVRAVELNGFSTAARQLGLTPSAVSRTISRLEQRLGVRLLARSTRSIALTPEGESFFARSRRIVEEIDDAENEVARHGRGPRGVLRLNCAMSFGQHHLLPALPDFLARHPELELDIALSDRVADLVHDAVDLAVRLGPVQDDTLVARKICDMGRTLCAAPAYLRRHGTPRRPQDLEKHNCLYIPGLPGLREWVFETAQGLVKFEAKGRVRVDTGEGLLALALAGVGIVRMADLAVAEPIRRGLLLPILTDSHRSDRVALFAVYPPHRRGTPKVQAMLDFLVERFSGTPWSVPGATRRPRTRRGASV
jgi:DNA-binding transcriptional LysR family regulator